MVGTSNLPVPEPTGCCGLVILSWSRVDPVAKCLSHGMISAAPPAQTPWQWPQPGQGISQLPGAVPEQMQLTSSP